MQQIGRGMRPAAGKEHLTILDHAGNCLTHGLPETQRQWTLEGAPKPAGHAPGWRCAPCGLLNSREAECCKQCGTRRPAVIGGKRHAPEVIRGSLSEMSSEAFARITRLPYRRFLAERRTERELRAYAEARGYQPGWVWHRLREQRERERKTR
jgi:superfamily II DNA or RNA helicase